MSTKKKTILIVTFPQGGPFVWAQNLAKHLEQHGWEAKISAGRKNYFFDQFKRYDVVHSCVALPFSLAKKFVLTIHGNFKEENHRSKYFFPIAISHADAITTPSSFLKNSLTIKNAIVIPNGIDLPEETKESYALIGKNPTVGILTNFNFRPKADGLFQLSKIIEKISPEIKLSIGGGGQFFEEYKKRILEIHPNTQFWGYYTREELLEQFRQTDIFAYYSNLDNQPIVVLEAMAYGLPTISNVVGSVEEVLTGEMEKYIARTDEDYQKILQTLLNSQSARIANGQAAQKKAQDFSWNAIVAQFIKIYET